MKKFDNVNLDQIVKVVTYIDLKDKNYVYIKPYKWLGINRGGYWEEAYGFSSRKIDIKDINSNRFVRDNEVFYKPHIEIHLSDGYCGRKWFESEEELKEYFKDAFVGINWLKDNKETI